MWCRLRHGTKLLDLSHVLSSYCWLDLQMLLNLCDRFRFWMTIALIIMCATILVLRSRCDSRLAWYSRRIYNHFLNSFYCLLLFIWRWGRLIDAYFNFLWLNTLFYKVLHFLCLLLITNNFRLFLDFYHLSFILSCKIWCLTKLSFLLVYKLNVMLIRKI